MTAKRKSNKKKLKITYNAPVTLTFSIVCTIILLLDGLLGHNLIGAFFCAPSCPGSAFAFDPTIPLNYIRLFTHVLGHESWTHLLSNLSFILLLGPLLEDRYGSGLLTLMIITTAFVTGIVNAAFIPTALMGSSGIAFMMILLASFNTIDKKTVPLTFILILVLYLGREIITSQNVDNVANWAHVIGGIIGSVFGFFAKPAKRKRVAKKAVKSEKIAKKTNKNATETPTELNDASLVGDPTLL